MFLDNLDKTVLMVAEHSRLQAIQRIFQIYRQELVGPVGIGRDIQRIPDKEIMAVAPADQVVLDTMIIRIGRAAAPAVAALVA